MATNVFAYTGAVQTWTVPDGVFRVYVDMLGAAGGGPNSGGRLQGFLRVVPGQVLNLYVGGSGSVPGIATGAAGGFNGGGAGGDAGAGGAGGCSGGGASDIRIGGTALSNRVCVAGGGAGSGRAGSGSGGVGGGTTGAAGAAGGTSQTGGGGGTQAAGGAAGSSTGATTAATAGTSGQGGAGASNTGSTRGGGGGGGGYFGGGGGGLNSTNPSSGGGGGSSYIGQLTDAADSQGDAHASSDGQITIYTGISISVNANSTVNSVDLAVPSDVASMDVDLIGGAGGGAPIDPDAGKAGRIKGTLAVTPGQSYRFTPGGMGTVRNPNTNAANAGGANGGGTGSAQLNATAAAGGGGGGASDIRTGGTALANRIVVAGGGGGISGGGVAGGAGGGTTGHVGSAAGSGVAAGGGGTQAAGGAAGTNGTGSQSAPTAGSSGTGGNGGTTTSGSTAGRGGGGGGAGYFGGGGGGAINAAGSGGGGGGGSNFEGSLTNLTDIQGDTVDGTGEGSVTVNFDTVVGIGDPNNIAMRASGDIVSWAAGTAVKVRYPNVVVTDDIIVLYQTTNGTQLVTPLGWNIGPTAVVGGVVRLTMYWKRASGLEAGDLDITITGAGGGYMLMESYSGCVKSGTPYTTSATNQSSTANTALNSGSINAVPSSDDGRYYQVSAWSWGTAQSGVPTVFGWTNASAPTGSINTLDGITAVRGIFTAQAYYSSSTNSVPFTATLKTSSTWAALTFDLLKQPPSMNNVQSAFELSVDTYWTTNNQLSANLASWFARGEIKLGVDTATNTGYFPKALGAARSMIDASLTWRMRAVNLDQGPAQLEAEIVDQASLNGYAAFWLGWGVPVGAGTGAVLEAVVNGGGGGDIAIVNLPTETGPVWCNITESGGILTFSYSIDGRKWITLLSTPWAGKVDLRSCVPAIATVPEGASAGQAALHQFYWGPVNVASPHQRPIGSGLRYNQCAVPNFDGAPNPNSLVKLPTEDSTFEGGTVGTWLGGGVNGPTLSNSAVHANTGSKSLLITWGSGAFPFAAPAALTGLIIGKRYFFRAMVYVPAGHPDIKLFCDSGATGAPTSIKGVFTPISLDFVATATSHQLQVWPNTSPTTGQQCWVDDVVFSEDPLLEFWIPGGSIPPIIEPSTDFADSGTKSLKVTWMGNGSLPGFNSNGDRPIECIIGHQYVIAFRHLATNSAYPMLSAVISGIGLASPYSGFPNNTTRDGTWKTYIGVFTATATTHSLSFWPTTTPSIGHVTYFDSVVFEDIDTFDPRNPIFDGNTSGGGWELHPNASRSYLVKHSEAVATQAIGAAAVTSSIQGQDKASGSVASSGTTVGNGQPRGTAATAGTALSIDQVFGAAQASVTALGQAASSGSATSSGSAQSSNSASGSAATSATTTAIDSVTGSLAASGTVQSATSASGSVASSATELVATTADGTTTSAGRPLGQDSASGSVDTSGTPMGQSDINHTGQLGTSAQPTGQSFNTALASLLTQEATASVGSVTSSGTASAADAASGSVASTGTTTALGVLSGTAQVTQIDVEANRADGTATLTSPLQGIDSAAGTVVSAGLIQVVAAVVNGLVTLSTLAVGRTFADGEVVATGEVIFGFHGFINATHDVITKADVATSVFAVRSAISGSLGVNSAAGSVASAGTPMGTHTAAHVSTASGQAQSATRVDALRALVTTALGTVVQDNRHTLPNPAEVIQQVTGLLIALGGVLGTDVLDAAIVSNTIAITPGIVTGHVALVDGNLPRANVHGQITATALIVAVSGTFHLWTGTELIDIELLGVWDGAQLVHTFVDGIWDGTKVIPQGFIASTV
jgi:hypothetical protein